MSVNMKQSGALVPIASLTKAIIPLGTGDCYSTEERQVGTWINGKPVYQKTFIITIPNQSGDILIPNTAITDWEFTVATGWTLQGKGERTYVPWNSGYTILLDEFSANGLWIYFASTIYAGDKLWFTVQYTKTTDTAGSGIWTPAGTYAKHMSTTEQVVGTYLGETVYAKVIDNLNITLNSSAWNNIANIAGAKDLVDLKMWGYFTEYYLINYSLAHIDSGGQGLLEIRVDSEANTRIVKRIYAEYTKTS